MEEGSSSSRSAIRRTFLPTKPGDTPVEVVDFEFDIEKKGEYSNLLTQMRTELIGGRDPVYGVHTMPPENPVDPKLGVEKNVYFRIRLLKGKRKRCVLFVRATDGYLVGFETKDSQLFEIPVNPTDKKIMNPDFCLLGGCIKDPVRTTFYGTYIGLIKEAEIVGKEVIPLDHVSIVNAVHCLSNAKEGETSTKDIAAAMLTSLVLFCEALKFRSIEKKVNKILRKDHVRGRKRLLGRRLAAWVTKWGKLSDLIGKGTEDGPNTTLKNWKLKDAKGKYITEVQEVKEVVQLVTTKQIEVYKKKQMLS